MNLKVEYIKNGINKMKSVESIEEAEKFIKENELIISDDIENENECIVTQ